MRSTAITCRWAIVLAAICALPGAAQRSGFRKAVLPDGSKVAGDSFDLKVRVFFSAGPQNGKSSSLTDDRCYFQVQDPSGGVLLTTDAAVCRQGEVRGGAPTGAVSSQLDTAHGEHATDVQTDAVAVQTGGAFRPCVIGARMAEMFCDPPNRGGEYTLWLIALSGAIAGCTPAVNSNGIGLRLNGKCFKTDNFSRKLPALAQVATCQFLGRLLHPPFPYAYQGLYRV